MPKFVIERHIPDAGRLSSRALQQIAQQSCGVLTELVHATIDPTTAEETQ